MTVAGIVDDIGVVAQEAFKSVGAGAAVERIVAVVAADHVGKRIAGETQRVSWFVRIRVKVLDVGPKGVIVVHDNVIVPCVCRFQYYGKTIAANIIFVIAVTASERVGSALPEETIAFVIAPDVVRATVAEPFKSGSRQDKIFDVGLKCVRN